MLKTRLLSAAQRAQAQSHWLNLEGEIPDPGLTCSWDWTGTWLAHYGDVVPHRFALAERDGALRGMALIAEPASPGRLRVPTIALGTAGEPEGSSVFVERNRLLARAEDRQAFAAELMAQLERGAGGWQRMRLDGMPLAEAELLLDGKAPAHWRVEESPVADLRAGEESDVLTALSASKRQRVRRALRHLGELETRWAQSVAEAEEMLDELIALHTARWRAEGKPGAFASPRFTAFHRALIARLLPSGRAALYRIERAGETLGCLYGLAEGERMLFYQGGLKRFEDNRLRVGIAAHALFMQACRDHGFHTYDFLAPANRYKNDLSTSSEQLVWAELERPGARLRLERAARRVKRGMTRARTPSPSR
jgi:CelD/BcsL family acetyltransferase involved in cellulose biosynthesis